MNAFNEKKIAELYSSRLHSGLDDHKVVGWGSRESQELRFEMLMHIGNIKNSSVLDVGCGLGAFYAFLLKNNSGISHFHGVDISEDLIMEAQKRYKNEENVDFALTNILDSPSEKDYDYSFMSGALNLRMSNNYEYAEQLINRMFAISRKGIACNFLSSYADFYADKDFHYEPERIFSICKGLTRYVTLKHDYPLYEFTILLKKE